ncbi:ATP-binding protein [Pelobacter seleniigenes]|uniref:ATP-binding protein n=1 Tax=Pelobacter seleniigenes TaxID=407188 RepID=UPI0006909995|nr:ATP-binding protein [Pelobacter seleniigenes]
MSQSISKALISRLTLLILCVNIVIILVFYTFSVRLAAEDFQSQIQVEAKHLADTFTQQLWLFDLNTTEQLADMAFNNRMIKGLRLYDQEYNVIVDKGEFPATGVSTISIPLIHDTKIQIGKLEIVFANTNWHKQENLILKISLITALATVFFSILLIHNLLRHHLVKPLRDLQNSMDRVADGQFIQSDIKGQKLEIQAIINKFNKMAQSLAQREEQQQKLEYELRQKYKMEAVGLLAGGIAHNFNNNLAIILGNLELAKIRKTDPAKVANHLEESIQAVLRARDLVMQILTYSRQDLHGLKPLQAIAIVDETMKFMRSTLPTTINLRYEVVESAKAAVIKGDASRIQEILINLCNNAVYAMEEKGRLTVCVDTMTLEQADIPARLNCQPGHYARIQVQDNGCGMSPEVLEKIFDPFFTTKKVNEGTGMGLSTVQAVVEQHHGLIKVQSQIGAGATFSLFFPLIEEASSKDEIIADDKALWSGTERILLIDDDQTLAEVGGQMLAELGYRVRVETNARTALKLLQKDPQQFDLLITDQTMPEVTGLEIIAEANALRPDLPTILSTGYSSKITEAELAKLNIRASCTKPLKLSALTKIIRQVLDEK